MQRPVGDRLVRRRRGGATVSGPTSRPARDRRETVRLAAGVIVILAFIALAALAIAASRSDFSIIGAPAGASVPAPEPGDLPVVPDLRTISTPLPMRPGVLPPVPVLDDVAPTTPSTLPPAPALPDDAPSGKPCEAFGLPAPDQVGGIQSLVRLIPLFGPFSPEAFAMLPAFQPGIDVLGPLFPTFEQGLDALAPVLDVATPVVVQLAEAGYGALAPLYGPVREDVLAGERQLAAFLQPIVQSLADTPGSECLIALEALLVSLQPGIQ